jgi:ParB-like chromosome segregation protein Spo0J
MHTAKKVVAFLLLPLFLVSSPALAQQARVVDSGAMSQALETKADSERAQRELVRRVLDRADVRETAARLGLNVTDAGSAVATLSGAELDALAQHAGAVEAAALAGGSNTIVISLTSLLLIVIIVILLTR